MGRVRGAHRRRSNHRVGGLLLGFVLFVVLVVVVLADGVVEPRGELPAARSTAGPSPTPSQSPPSTVEQPVAGTSPYAGVGTWLSRYRFTREFGGESPPVTPADVDAMADAGVRTLYLQPAADDPRYPGLLSTAILGEFIVRAHARDMQVVAWYLPRFGDIDGDLRRLTEAAAFRVDGQGFDAVAVDIEFTDAVELAPRNEALVDLSRQLRAALPDVELGAIVLPPVVTDVLNTAYWPDFPWRELRDLYDVWLPMAYWTNRNADSGYRDGFRYTDENIRRLRANLGATDAPVHPIGGLGDAATAKDYDGFVRAARAQGAIGWSIYNYSVTPRSAWTRLRAR